MTMSALELLLRAGWTPDRHVEVDHVVHFLLGESYDVVPPFQDFGARYLGLAVASEDGRSVLRFDMDEITALTNEGWCEAYGEAIGRRVTPVASLQGHAVLLIDETGAFWGAYDSEYGYMGDDIMQAIQWTLIDPPTAHKLDRELPD